MIAVSQKKFGRKVNNVNKENSHIFEGGWKMAKTETIAIKVTPEEKQKIKEIAEKEDVTVSKLLYRLIFKKESKQWKKIL